MARNQGGIGHGAQDVVTASEETTRAFGDVLL
jgi:hypothetical protein